MALELQVAGILFDAEDWRDYDDETREVLLDAARAENDFDDEEPTLIRAQARAGA